MATPGRSGKASALRRPGAGGRRDPDETDPAASLVDADPGDVVEAPAGAGDKTQVYDPAAASAARPAEFKLVVLAGPKAGAEYPVQQASVTVGRAAENPVSVPDVSVSRRHVKITRGRDGFVVEDLGSGNGTRVNDQRIDGPTPVKHGDEIALGDTVMQLVEVGAPAVKKRPRSPQPPSGEVAEPSAPTKDVKKLAPAEARPPATVAGGGPRKLKPLYLVAGGVFVLFFALVVAAKLKHAGAGPAPVVNDQPSASQQAMDDAMQLARENRWVEAEQRLRDVAATSSDGTVKEAYEKVRREAGYQQQLEEAKTKVAAHDFVGARSEAGAIPLSAAVYDGAQALVQSLPDAVAKTLDDAKAAKEAGNKEQATALVRAVLAFDPDDDDAADLLADLEKKPRPPPRKKKIEVKKTAVSAPAPSRSSPALSMYLAGDLGRAIQAAESANDPILPSLRRFEMYARDGLQKAQANKAAKAVLSLGQAVKLDRSLTHGKKSQPGQEVAKALGQQEYLLGVDCKGDSQLPRAAAHFKAAVDADPSQDLYQRALDKTYDKARDLYVQAYVGRSTDPDGSKRLFKIVCDTLPASDEKHDRACNFYAQLGGGN